MSVVVDIHFVRSFCLCLFSLTVLQYLISLLRCALRHSLMMVAATTRTTTERERDRERGGPETKFYQSLSSTHGHG